MRSRLTTTLATLAHLYGENRLITSEVIYSKRGNIADNGAQV